MISNFNFSQKKIRETFPNYFSELSSRKYFLGFVFTPGFELFLSKFPQRFPQVNVLAPELILASFSICHFFRFSARKFPHENSKSRVNRGKPKKLIFFLLPKGFFTFQFSTERKTFVSQFNQQPENALTRPPQRARQSNLFTQWVHKHY